VVAAVVPTVSIEVPEVFATDAGLSAHVGPRVTAGAMLHVKATALVKPLVGAIVIVEVADAPAATVAGASAVAAIVKSGAGGAVTVRLPDVEWFREPELPVIVTV
jgi:hypothetical protein